MKTKLLATYERESTLWKNANGFYHAQDWTKMECIFVDYSEEIEPLMKREIWFEDANGNDVTEQQIEKCYGKPYVIQFTNKRNTNWKCYEFKTAAEANEFFKRIMEDKILGNFKKVGA